MYTIKEQSTLLLPREKLSLLGADRLSEQELLAILLRTGTAKQSVFDLASGILRHFGNLTDFREASIEELCQISGIGRAKAVEIKAMMELGKRVQQASKIRLGQVMSLESLAESLIDEMADLGQEELRAIFLDGQNRIINKRTIFIGAVNHSIANPREILYYAIKHLAVGIIVAHNHPSGLSLPSQADKAFTKKMAEATSSIGLKFLDHFIIGHKDYFSFRQEGLLNSET